MGYSRYGGKTPNNTFQLVSAVTLDEKSYVALSRMTDESGGHKLFINKQGIGQGGKEWKSAGVTVPEDAEFIEQLIAGLVKYKEVVQAASTSKVKPDAN